MTREGFDKTVLLDRFVLAFTNWKFGNFCEDFIFAYAKFRENKTLAERQNHSVVY